MLLSTEDKVNEILKLVEVDKSVVCRVKEQNKEYIGGKYRMKKVTKAVITSSRVRKQEVLPATKAQPKRDAR